MMCRRHRHRRHHPRWPATLATPAPAASRSAWWRRHGAARHLAASYRGEAGRGRLSGDQRGVARVRRSSSRGAVPPGPRAGPGPAQTERGRATERVDGARIERGRARTEPVRARVLGARARARRQRLSL
eukprot:scaffold112302_cov67-Phaeocystis_antarctica.AAC.13